MIVFEVLSGELVDGLSRQAAEAGITDAAIVSLIGAADSFTVSTMPEGDALKDNITKYDLPGEMTGTGEIRNGLVHLHVVMGVEGDRAIPGHLHEAVIGTHFARSYAIPIA
ncbi:putative DNA-binding protein with PD1-like motif [Streptomyces sp. SAI-126]|uniref:PCC domain-containing protein n=1 Tax=Streptomyces sp. SAI-126 TaxID=3377732 RepID=UPI003C7ADA20